MDNAVKNKKVPGVTIFCGILIIFSVIGLIINGNPFRYLSIHHDMRSVVELIYIYTVSISTIIFCIFTLKYRNWARKGITILALISIFASTYVFVDFYINKFPGFMEERSIEERQIIAGKYKNEYLKQAFEQQEAREKKIGIYTPIFLVFCFLIWLSWRAGIIYFFTRPGIKSWFLP